MRRSSTCRRTDLNPIELAFAKIKAHLKKTAASSVTELWDAIRDAIDAIDALTPDDVRAVLTACGYAPKR